MAIRSTTVERRRELLADAIEVIEREYAGDLELEDVARRIATSRRQLQRVFAELGDSSFREHLTAVRMRHAVELLGGGRAQVRDVARAVGYRQPAQFAKAFRRHLGVAPSALRRAGTGASEAGDGLGRDVPAERKPHGEELLDGARAARSALAA